MGSVEPAARPQRRLGGCRASRWLDSQRYRGREESEEEEEEREERGEESAK